MGTHPMRPLLGESGMTAYLWEVTQVGEVTQVWEAVYKSRESFVEWMINSNGFMISVTAKEIWI